MPEPEQGSFVKSKALLVVSTLRTSKWIQADWQCWLAACHACIHVELVNGLNGFEATHQHTFMFKRLRQLCMVLMATQGINCTDDTSAVNLIPYLAICISSRRNSLSRLNIKCVLRVLVHRGGGGDNLQ